jgi:hypothetical protein
MNKAKGDRMFFGKKLSDGVWVDEVKDTRVEGREEQERRKRSLSLVRQFKKKRRKKKKRSKSNPTL